MAAHGNKSDYFFSLDAMSKLRFLSKIHLIGNGDAYMPGVGHSKDVTHTTIEENPNLDSK